MAKMKSISKKKEKEKKIPSRVNKRFCRQRRLLSRLQTRFWKSICSFLLDICNLQPTTYSFCRHACNWKPAGIQGFDPVGRRLVTTANKALPPIRHTFYCPMKDFVVRPFVRSSVRPFIRSSVRPSNGHTSNKPNILVFSAFLLFHFLKRKKKRL